MAGGEHAGARGSGSSRGACSCARGGAASWHLPKALCAGLVQERWVLCDRPTSAPDNLPTQEFKYILKVLLMSEDPSPWLLLKALKPEGMCFTADPGWTQAPPPSYPSCCNASLQNGLWHLSDIWFHPGIIPSPPHHQRLAERVHVGCPACTAWPLGDAAGRVRVLCGQAALRSGLGPLWERRAVCVLLWGRSRLG